jgi:ribose transport system substrate-binding protein
MMITTRIRRRMALLAVPLAAAVLVLAACSSGSGAATGQGTGMSASDADKIVQESYAGIGEPVPATGPAAQTGKKIWLITCPALAGCLRVDTGFEQAAKLLGWDVNVVDGKADPTTTINLIKQAVAAKVDGIVEVPLDCPLIKTGLQVAKDAGIPVLSWGGVDCNSTALGKDAESTALFAAPVKTNGADDWAGWYAAEGANSARFLVARLTQLGVKDPKILRFYNDDATLNAAEAKAFASTLKSECPNCALSDVTLTFAQIAAGKGPQIFSSGLQQHPEANVLYYGWDAMLESGLQTAVAPKAKQFSFSCCGDGNQSGLAQARAATGDTWAINAYGLERGSFAIADVMNRLFAGETSFPQEGGYSIFVDATHNMPAKGDYALGSYDYVAAYQKLWKVGS